MRRREFSLALGATAGQALMSASLPAAAQSGWPNRSIRLITPSPAGVGTDAFARLYAEHLGKALGQRVIDLCIKARFRPRIARETRDYAIMIGQVAAGLGIAIVPSDTQCIRLEGVTYRPVQGKDAVSALQLAYRQDLADEHALNLLAELRAGRA